MRRATLRWHQVTPGLVSLFLSVALVSGHGDHDHAEVPRPGLLGRADELQREHRFSEALEQLELLLKQQPTHAEAWLMKSTVHAVRGEHEESYAATLPLFGVASQLVAATAAANALSLSGKAEPSYELLASRLAKPCSDPPAVRCWAWATLAEIAVRLGRNEAACAHFETALESKPDDSHTRVTFGEFLIDQGDARAAWRLLWRSPINEAEKVVVSLAAKALGKPSHFAPKIGSTSRAAARFHLEIGNDPDLAWKIARANWDAFQREPVDVLLALRAGYAAGVDVGDIEEWLVETKLEDVRIKRERSR